MQIKQSLTGAWFVQLKNGLRFYCENKKEAEELKENLEKREIEKEK